MSAPPRATEQLVEEILRLHACPLTLDELVIETGQTRRTIERALEAMRDRGRADFLLDQGLRLWQLR